MSDADRPQIYLVTPQNFVPETFLPRLAAVLDAHPVACLRLALAEDDDLALGRVADAARETAHGRDVPMTIVRHVGLVERHGLDGVHLTDGARGVRRARAALGADAIVGAHCEASRHEGMTAGETGADYVAFGPAGASGLAAGETAGYDLFDWWSQMIELPVVAEGGLSVATVAALAPVTDFFAIGPEIWRADDAARALTALTAPLRA